MPVGLRCLLMSLFSNRKLVNAFSLICVVGLLLWARLIVTSNMSRTAVADDKKLHPEVQEVLPVFALESTDNPRTTHMQGDVSVSPIRDPFLVSDRYFPKPTLVDVLKQDQAKLQAQEAEISHERKLKE